ncbi:MAG TPA: dihydroneopterin aldolase [Clostridiales bacterium]|nr:dihydroneopterin aldolase [Clostridiales bacterium]
MDRILIKGLRVFAYHGVNPEEKENGQNFELDITLNVDLAKPCKTDCIDDTVSYAKVAKLAAKAMRSEKNDLIERAAQRVADEILQNFPVSSVTVLLKKPEAPIKDVDFGYVGVEITRARDE